MHGCSVPRGARVLVNDLGGARDGRADGVGGAVPDSADLVAAEIVAGGGEAVANRASVADRDGASSLVEQALDTWGRVDIVVNNAGITGAGALEDADVFARVVDTHLYGTANVLRAAWPHFTERGYGRVVNTSSGSMFGADGAADYAAAKGGIFALSRVLAVEHRNTNIKVNTIMPVAYTRMTAAIPDPTIVAWLEAWFPPEKVAPFVALLCHDSVPCTGETFVVGGGARRPRGVRDHGRALRPRSHPRVVPRPLRRRDVGPGRLPAHERLRRPRPLGRRPARTRAVLNGAAAAS